MQERRRFPRVEVSAPIFARRMSRDPALARGTTIIGTLINASRGGVAFGTDDGVEPGDLVELAVRTEDGSAPLQRYARVVACMEDVAHGQVVRCEFTEPTETLDWVAGLEPAPARSDEQ
jgi:hypothetical protein